MPELNYKRLPQLINKVNESERYIEGVVIVTGNIDAGRERIQFGGLDLDVDGRVRAKHLWNHDSYAPPIATIKSVREIGRSELPESVLSYAPDATGGVLVGREYLTNARANEVYEGIVKGAIDEMSCGIQLIDTAWLTKDEDPIFDILKYKLWDTSDVVYGMNPATVAMKSAALAAMPMDLHFDTVLATVAEFTSRIQDLKALREKDHRVLSSVNVDRVQHLLHRLDELALNAKTLAVRVDTDNPDLKAEAQRLAATFYKQALELHS